MSRKSMRKILVLALASMIALGSGLPGASIEGAQDYLQRAKQAYQMGNLSEAAKEYLTALMLFEQTGDKKGQAVCLTNLGLVYLELGEYKKSKEYSSKAMKLREGTEDRVPLAKNINNLALASIYLGEYEEAINGFTKALEINQNAKNQAGSLTNLKNIGLAYFHLGQYFKALKNYNAALQIAESNSAEPWSNPERWVLMNNIGAVYKKLGQTEKAMGIYIDLLNSGTKDDKNESYLLNNIGTIYRNLGDPIKALDYYQRALKKLRAEENREIKSLVLKNLGILYLLNLDQLEQAQKYLLESLALSEKREAKFEQSNCHTYLGELYFRMGQYEKSSAAFQTALRMAHEISAMEIEWIADYGLGRISEQHGDLRQAFNYYDRAIQNIESIRSRLQAERLKTSFLIDKVEAYEAIIRILSMLHATNPAGSYATLAYHYAERSKARAILDLITETGVHLRKPETNELEFQKRQVLSRINKIQNQLYTGTSPNNAGLVNELESLERNFESLELKTTQHDPNYSLLRGPTISDADTVQRFILDERSVLFQVFVGKKDIFSWLITKNDTRMVRYEKASALREKTKSFIKSVSNPSDESFDPLSQDVYTALFGPIEKFIPERTRGLFIIPDGIFYYLPFEALIKPVAGSQYSVASSLHPVASGKPQNRDVPTLAKSEGLRGPVYRYLVEYYDISYAPSASVLRTLAQIPRKKRAGGLLAIGDPTFSSEDPLMAGNGLNRSLVVDGMALERLFYSGEEVSRIQAYIPGPKEIYLKENATEKSFKGSVGKGFNVIHLATHSIIDEENIENSFIVLTEEKGSKESGLLRIDDIFNTHLESDLVVLASCRSAMGKLTAGEGIDGFARAFLYAGARAILVSLWGVNDQSTSFFMEQFYYNLGTGDTSAEALRKAKLKFIPASSYKHPFHWAPFIVMGDARQVIFKKSSAPLLLATTLGVLLVTIVLATLLRLTRSTRTAAS